MDARSKTYIKIDQMTKTLNLVQKKIGQKGKTFHSKIENYVQSGIKQCNVHMFDHLRTTNYFEGAT
jgi:hypothetical protein